MRLTAPLRAAAICTLMAVCSPTAQADGPEPTLAVKPTGRILMDGALYASPHKQDFPDGVAIPEVRLGANMTYGQWSSGIDVGVAYGKVGMRNMWIQYDFNPGNAVRFGNFIHEFGLQSTSLSKKCTFEQPMASALFTPGLQLGAMFTHRSPHWYAAASVHVEKSSVTQVMNYPAFNQQGYGVLTRQVARGGSPQSGLWQAGLSAGFATPQRHLVDNTDIHDAFTFDANYQTKVVQQQALGVTVDKAMNLFKLSPELLLCRGRLAFEGQGFWQQVNRRGGLEAYRAWSGYANFRAMVFGGPYRYSAGTAQLANPDRNALECVLNYNHVHLSDPGANLFGGNANNLSGTLNWYINPYITARLNYTFTHTWNRAGHGPLTLNTFQARLMVLF